MTQYSYKLTLSDGEIILVQSLLNEYFEKCKTNNTPAGLFAEKLQSKITYSTSQLGL